jgi:hypothetical protein
MVIAQHNLKFKVISFITYTRLVNKIFNYMCTANILLISLITMTNIIYIFSQIKI